MIWFINNKRPVTSEDEANMIRNKKNRETPTQFKKYISYTERSESGSLIKFIFPQCPNCGKYSLKPDYDLGKLINPQHVYDIVEKYGRYCHICGYKNGPPGSGLKQN